MAVKANKHGGLENVFGCLLPIDILMVCCETVYVCLLHLLLLSRIMFGVDTISTLLFQEVRKQVNKDFLGVALGKNN